MHTRILARNVLVMLLCVTLALSGCATTTQLQKEYSTFDTCFGKEKQNAMMLGALPGAFIGIGAALNNNKQSMVAGAALAVVGAIIGNKIAWQRCLAAFPVKVQTTETGNRNEALVAIRQKSGAKIPSKSLTIQSVNASPLVFGKDIECKARYIYIDVDPNKRDVKVKVYRNLIFKNPDGSTQQLTTSTEDVIQQGVRADNFNMPTPNWDEVKEFGSTSGWAIQYIVEVDGMKQEQIVPLSVPQLKIVAPHSANNAGLSASNIQSTNVDNTKVAKGTLVYNALNSKKVVMHISHTQEVVVLQRTKIGHINWLQIRLSDGNEGWIRGFQK